MAERCHGAAFVVLLLCFLVVRWVELRSVARPWRRAVEMYREVGLHVVPRFVKAPASIRLRDPTARPIRIGA